jgi:hypothetical protein
MSSFQVAQWLRQGIAAARAGDVEQARELLLQVVDADEYNERAWLWLSGVVDNDADREVCLENVLAINPDNRLAKAGLVHLRNQKVPAPPLFKPEPKPSPPPAAAREPKPTPPEWQSQPRTSEAAFESDGLLGERLAAAAAPTVEKTRADVEPEKKPARKKSRRRVRRLIQRLQLAAILSLALLTVSTGAMFILRAGPFDPTGRDYASAMRPLLADYDAWWSGPYGALVSELNSFCGPAAGSWRNQDVLLNCGRYPSVDCALLAAHCESDVDVMRERVSELSLEAQKAGETLLTTLDAISPPDDIAVAHARFLACLQARVIEAGRVGEVARGESPSGSAPLPAHQMFSTAEDEVRQYVDSQ